VEVRKESGRGKDRFKIWDLLANTRCSQPVLDYLSTMAVGRRVPPLLRTTRRARRQSENPRSGEKEKRRGGFRPRSRVRSLGNAPATVV
jgi:hypothetical protein